MKTLIFLFALSPWLIFGQDISGKWIGEITQQPNRVFYYEILVEMGPGKTVSGTTVIRDNASGNYGVIAYKGDFENNLLYFRESEIIREDKSEEDGFWKSNTFEWCIKTGLLRFSESEDETKLEGPWSSKTGQCKPGKITVSRQKGVRKKKKMMNFLT